MQPSQVKTIQGYIAQFPKPIQKILLELHALIKVTAPDTVESITYGMPTFKLGGKPLVYFAAWDHHIGFYATPSGNAAFKKELSMYKVAKGSVRFPLDEPLPLPLIKKMVKFKIKETLKKD